MRAALNERRWTAVHGHMGTRSEATFLLVLVAGCGRDAIPIERDASVDASGGRGAVAVVLAAGVRGAADGCWFAGEAASDARGCALHAMTWDLDGAAATAHAVVVDPPTAGEGAWQATFDPTGTWLAFAHRHAAGVSVRVRTVTGAADDLGAALPGPPIQAWPTWSIDGAVAVSTADPSATCARPDGTCVPVARWQRTSVVADAATAPVGPVVVAGDRSFAFEGTIGHPTIASLLAGHGKFDAGGPTAPRACGGGAPTPAPSCPTLTQSPMPIVVDRDDGRAWVLDLRAVIDGVPVALEGCAHADWSPDGTRLLCTEQGTPALAGGRQSQIFALPFDPAVAPGVVPTDAAPLFAHRPAAELFELASDQACDVFHHKYARWCGDDAVLATIACGCETAACQAEAGGPTLLIADRVFLIDLIDPAAPRYHDLTAALEAELGAAAGSLTSFTADCHRGG